MRELYATQPPTLLPDARACEEVSKALKFELPQDYRAFIERYGAGLTAGLLLIWLPRGDEPCQSILEYERTAEQDREALAARHRTRALRPDGDEASFARLVFFGTSENGHTLAWDRRDASIIVIHQRDAKCIRAARTLDELVERETTDGPGPTTAARAAIASSPSTSKAPSFLPSAAPPAIGRERSPRLSLAQSRIEASIGA